MGEAFSRDGTGSAKWARAGAGRIAMGIADMDLPGPAAVGAALRVRAGHPAFGYPVAEEADRVLVARWYRRRHGVEVPPQWVMLLPFAPGTAVRLLLEAARPLSGPAVCVTPEWNGFVRACRAAGVPVREVPLLSPGQQENAFRSVREASLSHSPGQRENAFRLVPGVPPLHSPHQLDSAFRLVPEVPPLHSPDQQENAFPLVPEVPPLRSPNQRENAFRSMPEAPLASPASLPHSPDQRENAFRLPLQEIAAARPGMVLLSSPNNPTGLLWPAEDIRALARTAAPGLLVSDEVHGDLRHPDAGVPHPVAVAVTDGAPNVVTLNSVGKTFNVSGVPSCLALVPDPALRARLTEVMAGFGLWEGGLLGALVQRAALAEGEAWLAGLLERLVTAREAATAALGDAVLARPQASFLLWLDGSGLGTREQLLTQRQVELANGSDFGPAGSGCLRLNFALPPDRLRTALTRLTCTTAS
ncbi:aminotransferase class I/II-fold pyridoxal phosphate-dependent enzyme [Kitasatospora sp. NPDC059673]|uniref:aminotransferase class I/II-fold pyridoxal phosphate-dependent enzyme n=1 Tax=Kitasatospora sp. NPDC059673 TaxID=3346901 RepID=UPI0036C09C91